MVLCFLPMMIQHLPGQAYYWQARLKLRFIAPQRSKLELRGHKPIFDSLTRQQPNGIQFFDSLLFRLATNWLSYSVLYPLPIEFYYMTTLNRLGKELNLSQENNPCQFLPTRRFSASMLLAMARSDMSPLQSIAPESRTGAQRGIREQPILSVAASSFKGKAFRDSYKEEKKFHAGIDRQQ